jgi:hypothetical protein
MRNGIPSEKIKAGEKRISKSSKRKYLVINFDPYTFVNNDPTWLVEYELDNKRYYRPQTLILEDKIAR